jgi:hypothetical protein
VKKVQGKNETCGKTLSETLRCPMGGKNLQKLVTKTNQITDEQEKLIER